MVVTLLAAGLGLASLRRRGVGAVLLVLLGAAGCDAPNAPEAPRARSTSRVSLETPYKVKDLRAVGPASSDVSPKLSVLAGSTLFFAARDEDHGYELWKLDGTTAGAVLVKDLRPGPEDGLGTHAKMIAVGDRVVFFADDGQHGYEVWSSDGTAAGTVLLADIHPGEASGVVNEELLEHGGSAYFSGASAPGDSNLWKTDGTPEGTRALLDTGSVSLLTAVGPTLYFKLSLGSLSSSLWKTDGTRAGTVQVKYRGAESVSAMANVQGTLMFLGSDGVSSGVWKSDGTAAGTVLVKALSVSGQAAKPASIGATLFFFVGNQLWKSDGTAAGTVAVKSLGSSSSSIAHLMVREGLLYFTVGDTSYSSSRLLWRSDGSEAGTLQVSSTVRFSGYPGDPGPVPFNGALYFPGHGSELWRTDGVQTTRVRDLHPAWTSAPSRMVAAGSTLYLWVGQEWWKTDGTSAGTVRADELRRPAKSGSNPRELTELNGKLLFLAVTDAFSEGLWVSDGTEGGTRLVKTLLQTSGKLVRFGPHVYFSHGSKLWRTDGSPEGTQQVTSFLPDQDVSAPEALTPVGDSLFFLASHPTFGRDLYRYPSASGGVERVADLSLNSIITALTGAEHLVYLVAYTAENGTELWRSDGTAAGTFLVRDIAPGVASSNPSGLTSVGGEVIVFTASDGVNGNRFWRSDGTAAGTFMIEPGPAVVGGAEFMRVGNGAFFAGYTVDAYSRSSVDLFWTDGTIPGTRRIAELNQTGNQSLSLPAGFTRWNGRALFHVDDGVHGRQLWVSDGTAGGTRPSLDAPLSWAGVTVSPRQTPLVPVDLDPPMFAAADETSGAEPWTTGGTLASSHAVFDIRPGPASSNPREFRRAGELVFFSADDGEGHELWAVRAPLPTLPVSSGGDPTVALTAPSSTSRAAGRVWVAAVASDDQAVERVEFYGDGVLMGTDTSAPYALDWDSAAVTDGAHALTAKAYDTGGRVGSSAEVVVSIDNTPPDAALTSPTQGTFLRGSVVLEATASDNPAVFKVEFYDGWKLLGTDSTAPYTMSWDTGLIPYGTHVLSVKALDVAGNVRTSATVGVTVDPIAPKVALAAPGQNARVGGVVQVSATADDLGGVERVELYADGVLLGTDTSAPYSVSWDTPGVTEGAHTLFAKAYDVADNAATSAEVKVTVDNTAPGAALSAPGQNAWLRGTVQVSATAGDNQAVTRVEFYDGPTLLGTDTISPYAMSWNTVGVTDGAHSLTVRAYDAAGNVGASTAVGVTLDNTAPTVALNALAQGAHVGGSVQLSATASDNLGVTKVEFYVDGALLGTDTSAPYALDWDSAAVVDGAHTLTAKAYDLAGNVGTSAEVRVTVDTLAPTVALSAPGQNARLRGTVQVSATASDNLGVTKVELYVDGTWLGTDDASPFAMSWNTGGVTDGAHSLTVRAYDAAGNVGTSTAVAVTVDNIAPTVALSAPAQNVGLRGSVQVSATASDTEGVAKVEFYVDGTLLGTDTSAPYGLSWNTAGVTEGAHVLTARAFDSSGNVGTSAEVAVTVDNTAPTVALGAPGQNAHVGGLVQVSATASDNLGVARVEFYVDGTLLDADTSAPHGTSWNSAVVAEGTHSLTVKAYDAAGNVGTSSAVGVTVDNTAPTTALSAPAQNAWLRGTVQVSATASDNRGVARVEFYADGTLLGTDTTAPYAVNWDTATGANGGITLTTRSYDAAGNVTQSAGRAVSVDNAAPTVALTSPANGASLFLSTTVQASASDNVGVTQVVFYDGTTVIGTDTTAPYSVSWNLLNVSKGTHTLTAKAHDAVGNVTTSAAISVKVN
ncbi:Ig-like domain-containing protein [Archangium sp.]|uniref:Ig-like domain-containing protein n=1 Tax=Archangium sp. TaxID=1872627 RepID=UPI002EDAE604